MLVRRETQRLVLCAAQDESVITDETGATFGLFHEQSDVADEHRVQQVLAEEVIT